VLACKSVQTQHFDRGGSVTSQRSVERTSVNFDQEFDDGTAFLPEIPEGTRVRVKDRNHAEIPGTRYEWRDGAVVPSRSD